MYKNSIILCVVIFFGLLLVSAKAAKLSDYPLTATLSNSSTFPIVQSSANANVNWSTLKSLTTLGINWTSIPNTIQNSNVNWSDLKTQAASLTGINWQYMSNQGNGINWAIAANGAAASTIMCWKSNGQPGKCTTGVSGAACTSCL